MTVDRHGAPRAAARAQHAHRKQLHCEHERVTAQTVDIRGAYEVWQARDRTAVKYCAPFGLRWVWKLRLGEKQQEQGVWLHVGLVVSIVVCFTVCGHAASA